MGLVLLGTARLSGNPTAYGLVVLIGYLFVAMSCAMHLSAVLDRLLGRSAGLRVSAKTVLWLVMSIGTAWLIGRTPSQEVVLALITVPMAVGISGVVVARGDRPPAVAFLAIAVLAMALSVWVLVD